MKWLIVLILLAGCAGTPTVVSIPEPVTVKIPVPVSCVSAMPAKPATTTDQELAAMNDYALVLALRREVLTLRGYLAELEAVLTGCLAPNV